MPLVAGIDSSTQSCKVVIRDAETGALVRQASAPHPDGTEIDPAHWWTALQAALAAAGGLTDVAAVAVAAQQHGLVGLAENGTVVRDALLWNDLRSAPDAADLVADLDGGAGAWAAATGSVPVASFTVTKLRWLARVEPDHAARTAAVCLPHDWLTWRLGGTADLADLRTDRGDASGTGYWSPADRRLSRRPARARARPRCPACRGCWRRTSRPGTTADRGAARAAAPATTPAPHSGWVPARGPHRVDRYVRGHLGGQPDPRPPMLGGLVAGFADATGAFLPLACTLNAARVLDVAARLLGVDHDEFARLALSAPPGADGLVLVPYLEGERTPDRPGRHRRPARRAAGEHHPGQSGPRRRRGAALRAGRRGRRAADLRRQRSSASC